MSWKDDPPATLIRISFHFFSSLFHFPLHLLEWALTPFHAEMAEILFSNVESPKWDDWVSSSGRILRARWAFMKKIWSLVNRSIKTDVLSIHCAGLLRLKFCRPCFQLLRPLICSFAASSVVRRHKVFGAGHRFPLEIIDVSYNKKHLRCFRIIYLGGTTWYIASKHIKIPQL